ncbi:hypothetical protein DPMN_121571 [Dreissena polymorpha]|uniref:Uncharacterized protein n=1 Tax=Dreissena polymorpha TaxID=45954 RepID=A0A9D4JT87_DREPO|nr:hypothetical protein DPMN_121571 [Dreissena polymorpha]
MTEQGTLEIPGLYPAIRRISQAFHSVSNLHDNLAFIYLKRQSHEFHILGSPDNSCGV